MGGERIFCVHCGVQIRMRIAGGWEHAARVGPIPCPAAEQERTRDADTASSEQEQT